MQEIELQAIPDGTITSARGFHAGAVHAGLKAREELPDLGLFYSEAPCVTAGVFTTNKIKAPSVLLCTKNLTQGRARAIVVNSGCANACTGEQGFQDALEMMTLAARKLSIPAEEVLIASTGVIGVPLPMECIRSGIERIPIYRDGGHELAQAIITTDTGPKEVAVAFDIDGVKGTMGGIAKGAGMIHPDMATLLCFLATDAAVDLDFLQTALKRAIDLSFNMITIDGDTSPNDTVLLLANGLAGNEPIRDGPPAEKFQRALEQVCLQLAREVIRDGEGVTKLIEVVVEGARNEAEARVAARTIAASSLVKAAVHGSDPNWGRIIAALGRSGAEVDEAKIDLFLNDMCLFQKGAPNAFNEEKAWSILNGAESKIRVCLNLGDGRATAWGCDLSEEYVTINSEYTT